jgi:sulfur relay (sulfurtransferase) complex TusBCD TusD component (DsrE family)
LGALSLLVSNVREELAMARRKFLSQLLGLPFFALGATAAQEPKKVLNIMMRSSWGTDDPSRGSFVFAHALALADAGHEVQIFLTGDATYLMRKVTTDAVTPIGWPALSELREKIVAKHIPVFSCGACSRARGVSESDLATWNAKYGNPTIFVSLVEWSDRILAE